MQSLLCKLWDISGLKRGTKNVALICFDPITPVIQLIGLAWSPIPFLCDPVPVSHAVRSTVNTLLEPERFLQPNHFNFTRYV